MAQQNSKGSEEGWQVLSSHSQFNDGHVDVAIEHVASPTRASGRAWTVVHRKTAVAVAPMTADGRIVLIRQERIPIRATIWEVPAGQIDEADAPGAAEIEKVVLKELREETGYQLSPGGALTSLGGFYSSPGFTDEYVFLFLARPVESSAEGHRHDESESIVQCQTFSADELTRMISENEISDGNTLSIFACLTARGLLTPGGAAL